MFQRYEVSVARSSSPGLARILQLVRLGDLWYPGPGYVLTVQLQDMREIGRLLPVGSEIGEMSELISPSAGRDWSTPSQRSGPRSY